MARDGNGRYVIPQSSWYPPINGVDASPDDFKNLIEDIASALTQSLSSDGQTAIRNNLNMNGYRMTNVGAPQANGDAISRAFLSKGNDVPRSTNLILPSQGSFFNVTGTGTIEAISASFTGRQVWLRFGSGVTLIDSDNLYLIGGKNWETNDGDMGLFIELEPGVWACASVNRFGSAAYVDIPDGATEFGSASVKDVVDDADDTDADKVLTTGYKLDKLAGDLPINRTTGNLPYSRVSGAPKITVSTSNPSGGNNGDVWLKV